MKASKFVGKLISLVFTTILGVIGKVLFGRRHKSKTPKPRVKRYKPGYSSGPKYQTKDRDWLPK